MSDERKVVVAAVLRELAQLFRKVESVGDYVGPDERFEVSVTATIVYLATDLEERADALERGAPLAGDDDE
jgi:hypothetical protein